MVKLFEHEAYSDCPEFKRTRCFHCLLWLGRCLNLTKA